MVTGEEARRIERLDTETVKDEISELLSKVFKDKLAKWAVDVSQLTDEQRATIFRPVDIHVCKWDTNPYFHGSYSFLPTGADLPGSSLSWSHLTSPINPSNPE